MAGSAARSVAVEASIEVPRPEEHCGSWPLVHSGHEGCSLAGSSDAVAASIHSVPSVLATEATASDSGLVVAVAGSADSSHS